MVGFKADHQAGGFTLPTTHADTFCCHSSLTNTSAGEHVAEASFSIPDDCLLKKKKKKSAEKQPRATILRTQHQWKLTKRYQPHRLETRDGHFP